jgi:aspartate aminotransferase-like enzyme
VPAQTGAAEIREAEDLTRSLFEIGDEHDVLLFQAEAIASLEAATKALAVRDAPSVSVLTSVYGEDMAAWFAACGSTTATLDLLGQDRAATPAEVAQVLDEHPGVKALAIVQGEALTGMVNPIDEIAALAGSRGVALMIDSASSVGAEPFTPERWGPAISVIGAQKAMSGPAGLSVVVIERSLWANLEANPGAPRRSFLSLLDLKHNWLDRGRRGFFGSPNSEELFVLLRALRSLSERGIEAVQREHQQAKALARAAVRAIPELRLTVADDQASGISTTFRPQDPAIDPERLLTELAAHGVGSIKRGADAQTLRWVHYGEGARPEPVERAGEALSRAIRRQASTRESVA